MHIISFVRKSCYEWTRHVIVNYTREKKEPKNEQLENMSQITKQQATHITECEIVPFLFESNRTNTQNCWTNWIEHQVKNLARFKWEICQAFHIPYNTRLLNNRVFIFLLSFFFILLCICSSNRILSDAFDGKWKFHFTISTQTQHPTFIWTTSGCNICSESSWCKQSNNNENNLIEEGKRRIFIVMCWGIQSASNFTSIPQYIRG